MFSSCKNAASLVFTSHEESALISGISDIVVVRWSPTKYKSSPFVVCFGSLTHYVKKQTISVWINQQLISTEEFWVNVYGYLQPFHPSSETLGQFNLRHGNNTIEFRTTGIALKAEIYLYELQDKIIISDMDGTLTKTDLRGIYHNCKGSHYLHDGYETFVRETVRNGYKVIWITMRSIAMYQFSKEYIRRHVGAEGALFPEPEEFVPSLKKQIMKKTSNIKTNMIKMVQNLFPSTINPFYGGLGNRDNDAIAYLAVGIPRDKIYLVSEDSQLSTLDGETMNNFNQLYSQIDKHFPPTQAVIARLHKKTFISMKLSRKKKYRKMTKESLSNFRESKTESNATTLL